MRFEPIPPELIEAGNAASLAEHRRDLESLAERLGRRGLDLEALLAEASKLEIALPSWGFSQGGTRFGRFPAAVEPMTLEEKLTAAAQVNDLTRVTPRVSLHIPWDRPENPKSLRKRMRAHGLAADAMNSNTFQDQPGQRHSYKYGSLSHTDPAVRRQAIQHNVECVEIGAQLGSKALTVWLADGSSFPGQQHFRRTLDRLIASLAEIYAALPEAWRLLVEYKPFEPAFYATVVQDWGTAMMVCEELGPKAQCLVDMGHHLPNTNVEQIVARLIARKRLGGFHFNDSTYADDDLSSGSVNPYQLFLVFNELTDAARDKALKARHGKFATSLMIDQSHNVKDPVEDLIGSAEEIHRSAVKSLLVDRDLLSEAQESNDVALAEGCLKTAFNMDVSPLLAEVRRRGGGAIDPAATYRAFLKAAGAST